MSAFALHEKVWHERLAKDALLVSGSSALVLLMLFRLVLQVVLYIQIVVFHIEGRHTFQELGVGRADGSLQTMHLQEPGFGAVITKFEAKTFSQDGKAVNDSHHPKQVHDR